MKITRYFALGAIFWISSCASKPNLTEPIFNEMEVIWASIHNDISRLFHIGRKSDWMEAAEERFPIKTSSDLDKALSYIGEEDSEQKNIERKASLTDHLTNSASAYWYGFECDFSTIVFFDQNGNQIYAYPEEYAMNKNAEQVVAPDGE